jgi:hypothetical protein
MLAEFAGVLQHLPGVAGFIAAKTIERGRAVGFFLVSDGETDGLGDYFEFLFEFAGVVHAGLAEVDGFHFDAHGAIDAPVRGEHEVDESGLVFAFRLPFFVVILAHGLELLFAFVGEHQRLGEQVEAYGYVNRALPKADLGAFVEALATRISKFDKWAIANTKRLVNTSLPPDVELVAGLDACIASLGRPAAQDGIKALMARGFHKRGMWKPGLDTT